MAGIFLKMKTIGYLTPKLVMKPVFFDLKILPDSIVVSVPVKNSIYQYTTTFKNYYDASEYMEQRFYDFIL
jgi:hypothetical protein